MCKFILPLIHWVRFYPFDILSSEVDYWTRPRRHYFPVFSCPRFHALLRSLAKQNLDSQRQLSSFPQLSEKGNYWTHIMNNTNDIILCTIGIKLYRPRCSYLLLALSSKHFLTQETCISSRNWDPKIPSPRTLFYLKSIITSVHTNTCIFILLQIWLNDISTIYIPFRIGR